MTQPHTYTQVAEKSYGKSQAGQEPPKAATPAAIGAEERYDRVAKAAYRRAEQRGFVPGGALQDWLDAEAEIDQLVTQVSRKA